MCIKRSLSPLKQWEDASRQPEFTPAPPEFTPAGQEFIPPPPEEERAAEFPPGGREFHEPAQEFSGPAPAGDRGRRAGDREEGRPGRAARGTPSGRGNARSRQAGAGARAALRMAGMALSAAVVVTVASALSGGSFLPQLGQAANQLAQQLNGALVEPQPGMDLGDALLDWTGADGQGGPRPGRRGRR